MPNDSYYIKEILKGDVETASFALVKKYEKKIFNLCFRILKNREVAEEVAQDAFLKSFRELKKLRDSSKYEIWLSRIAYHLSIDVKRKKKRHFSDINDIDSLVMGRVAGFSMDHLDRKKAIEQMLQEIPSEDAALLTLYYLNELGVKEVAEVMKLSVSNVKVKLHRTREMLKKHLNDKFKGEVYDLY